MALDLDFLSQIVNVNWDVADEQALLVTDFNASLAIALDSGETFSGVNSGASGQLLHNTFTVLSPGIVVYGKPRNGDACFMACVDGTTILRGFQKEDDDADIIVWNSVYKIPSGGVDSSSGLSSLSFAGDAFFVMYITDVRKTAQCMVSFNGTTFSNSSEPYAGVPFAILNDEQVPGSTAAIQLTEEPPSYLYASAGLLDTSPSRPEIIGKGDFSMMWASSPNGMIWSSGYSSLETTDPGVDFNEISMSGGVAFTNIAGGNDVFVAAATARSKFVMFASGPPPYTTRPTAAAAVSKNGSSWATIKLPGALQAAYDSSTGVNNSSVASSVAFIKTKKSESSKQPGYFVITATGDQQTGDLRTLESWCWTGSNGTDWDMVKSVSGGGFGTVSAIAKDLGATKIVRI